MAIVERSSSPRAALDWWADQGNRGHAECYAHAYRAAGAASGLVELWNAVVTACKHEGDKPVADVLAAVRNAVVELRLALDRNTVK
jgi:hypothetical protein